MIKIITNSLRIALCFLLLSSCNSEFLFLTSQTYSENLSEAPSIESEIMEVCKNSYLQSLANGKKYLEVLEAKLSKPVDSQRTKQQKKEDEKLFKKEYTHILSINKYYTKDPIAMLDTKHNLIDEIKFYNGFAEKNIYCFGNYKTNDDNKTQSMTNSSALWNQLSYVNKSKILGEQNLSFENIHRLDISNTETLKTSYWIINKSKEPNKLEYIFSADSEEGIALLGTPNGRSSIWICHDYIEEIAKKTPRYIKLYNLEFSKTTGELKAMNMCIHVE